jgi:hypothetical protein
VKDEASVSARIAAMVSVAKLLSENPEDFMKLGHDAVDLPALAFLIVDEFHTNPYCLGFLLGYVVDRLSRIGLPRDEIVRHVGMIFETLRVVGLSSEVAVVPS